MPLPPWTPRGGSRVPAFERDVYLAPLRGSDAWRGIVARLTVAQTVVSREFERCRGRALLGL